MSRGPRLLAGGFVAAVVAAVIATLSSLPLPGAPPVEGVLLLDWRLRGEEAGTCPRPSPENLEALPPHMRNPDACVGELPPYRLRLWIDEALVLDDRVRGGGVRGDGPLTVFRTLGIEPGTRTARVEFAREDGDPAAILLEAVGSFTVGPGDIHLLVRRQDTGELTLRPPVR
jgi:hypothetical protein